MTGDNQTLAIGPAVTTELSPERLLTRKEVEQVFGYPSKRFLELAALRGDGPMMVRIGRSVRYRVSDLISRIAAHQVASTSDVSDHHREISHEKRST